MRRNRRFAKSLPFVFPLLAISGLLVVAASQFGRPAPAIAQSTGGKEPNELAQVKAPVHCRVEMPDANSDRPVSEHGQERERAISAALYWIARHQLADGSWSLERFNVCCTDKSCTGAGNTESFSAATAMALSAFLSASQTQISDGPFKRTIADGVDWLIRHQLADGDLSADAGQQMYSHGIAALALCRDYGITRDKSVGRAAQRAINFIQASQNPKTGGWRYHPGEEGDLSVSGWQIAALTEAVESGLSVDPAARDLAKKFVNSCAKSGADEGKFSYMPDDKPAPTVSAIGILSLQTHSWPEPATVKSGVRYLMTNLPDVAHRNTYYWYFASHAMHHMADKDRDTWNKTIRKILIDTQQHSGCATGSWDPEKPSSDAWGRQGGRLMVTCFSCEILGFFGERHWNVYRPDDPK